MDEQMNYDLLKDLVWNNLCRTELDGRLLTVTDSVQVDRFRQRHDDGPDGNRLRMRLSSGVNRRLTGCSGVAAQAGPVTSA